MILAVQSHEGRIVHFMSGEIKTVGVVGLGVMGFDIAFLYAMKGYQTVAFDVSKAAMDSVHARREHTIERLKRRNRISEGEIKNLQGLLRPSVDLVSLAEADLITEAVSENAKIKLAVYRALRDAGFSGILTTNTSSVTRATLLADAGYDRRRFALTHFFNPVLYTQMVEVVKGDMDEASGATTHTFLKRLGRDPVETRDISGFVSNSMLMFYAVMALRLLECGARIEQVDQAAQELRLLPPFISFDSWKPAIVDDVTKIMFELRGDVFLRSSKLLSALAKDDRKFYLNQKPNPGVYELAEAGGKTLDDATVKRALRTSMIIAAARVAELGEFPATVDRIATQGIKVPQAPLREIDSLGAAAVLQELSAINRELAHSPLAPPPLLAAMASSGQTFYRDGQANPWLSSQVATLNQHASH
jgi:3-hydroxyacyl-CoA dehydrogenase